MSPKQNSSSRSSQPLDSDPREPIPMEECSETILVCTFCEQTFDVISSLEKHIESSHNHVGEEANFNCENCTMRFKSEADLKEHSETTHIQNSLQCDSCEYKCKSKSHLNYHMISCHNNTTGSPTSTIVYQSPSTAPQPSTSATPATEVPSPTM